ncbi:gap junction Cx32.2 protein-like [Odontesthes bonariensis]|uniref:gap junction Cx32.2 protein-like n=1 Tax=Odontesthes bonariensis TaxID=219752 RepID=UPI003F58B4A9
MSRLLKAVTMGEWSFLSDLLDKVQSHSTVFGKVWMSVLFLFRIFILAAGVDKIWGDELANMNCNTKSVGCTNFCYDRSFPLSHTRFWVLQILTVSTPTLIYLGHVLLVIRKENKMRRRLHQKMSKTGMNKVPRYSDESGKVQLKGVLLVSYLIQLVFKIMLEVSFIVGQYYLYGFILMPAKISCHTYPCRTPVDCFISRPTEKTIFIVFMLAMAVLSVFLNIVEMFHLMLSKMKEKKKRRSSRSIPHEVSCPNQKPGGVTFC